MQIEILDPIECRCDVALAQIIKPCVSYTSVFYQQGFYRKIRREYEKSVLKKGDNRYYFYTGLLPRILNYCKEKNVPVTIIGEEERVPASTSIPESFVSALKKENIVLREEQLRLMLKEIKAHRGVLVSGTGSGKTIMGLGVISAFLEENPRLKVLWLCHTKDLMYQSGKIAQRLLGIKVGYIGDGQFDSGKPFVSATRQSFDKISTDIGFEFDIVVIDEVHHVNIEGQYADLMKTIFAPVRIGLTATMPKEKERILGIESFIGPVIDEVTIKESQERKSMADIKIRFLKVPVSHQIKELRKYQDVYKAAVVDRSIRHELVVSKAKEHISKGDSVLIIVNHIEHGNNLLREFTKQNTKAVFVQGITEARVRTQIKEALNTKNIHAVIATTVFKEGVDFPELNVIINAAGGKSEIATMQALGRGLRRTETKKMLFLYDIFDPSNRFLIEHFGERVCLYSDNEWI